MLGARQSLLALVRRLDPARYRPIVCCQTEGGLTEALRKYGIEWHLIKTGWWRKGRYWPFIPIALWQLQNLIRRCGADLIHCNEIYPNPFAVVVGKWTGTPVVTHVRFNVTPRMILNYKLDAAARLITVSQDASRDFDFWPDKAKRVAVIYNGVEAADFQTARSRAEIRQSLGIRDGDFVAGLVATWASRKRQHVAIQAARELASRQPNFRLLLVGGAAVAQRDYENELRSLVAQWKLEERVRLMPFTDSVAEIYTACDVNLLISGDEVFGRTIIEAGAAGRPTIGTRAGGIPELIRDGHSGWLIPLDDPKALAEKIESLAADPALLEAAGAEARRDAESRFSITLHAEQIQSLYDSVLGGL